MNKHQEMWLDQVKSDYKIFVLLREKKAEPCHILHYLQMTTEKLGKAYLWKYNQAPKLKHSTLITYLKTIGADKPAKVVLALGLNSSKSLESFIRSALPIAYEITALAPAIAGFDKPNAEYPWPHELPLHTPCKYHYNLWDLLNDDAYGRQFLTALPKLIDNLPYYS